MSNDFIDRTVEKLHRKYGKDELVATLVRQVKEKDIKIGKLISEIHYLEDKIKKIDDKKEITKQARIQERKEQRFIELSKRNKKLIKQANELRKVRDKLISDNVKLKSNENYRRDP